MNKKGQMELRLVMLVIAVVILFIVIVVISGQFKKFGDATEQAKICQEDSGICVKGNSCPQETPNKQSGIFTDCEALGYDICCKKTEQVNKK